MTLDQPARALLAAFVAGVFAGWRPRPIRAEHRGTVRLALAVAGVGLLSAVRGNAIRGLLSYAHRHVVTEAHA